MRTIGHAQLIKNTLTWARCIGANPPHLNMGKNLTPREEEKNNSMITLWKRSPEVLRYMPTYEEACRGIRFRLPSSTL
tara:strand:+ start:587 stop:820 length:234 start_codon:yes stop_codon:yes gene_type:complete